MIRRTLQSAIERSLFQGKAIIIYGARQVGKTTLLSALRAKCDAPSIYLNCDEPDIRRSLSGKTSTELIALVGQNRLVLIDEAQRVPNIGLTIKLLTDTAPGIQVVATGSSAFELSNRIVEPLTGRKREFRLYPFSLGELGQLYSPLEIGRLVERLMVTGLFAQLLGVRPRALHEWYLAVYVDAVEWVELPNTLGMSQYTDGGRMASKPYVASGQYIKRMSNYCEHCRYRPDETLGEQACPFTTLYWDFLDRHRARFSRHPRTALQWRNLDRLSPEHLAAIRQQAQDIRTHLTGDPT